MSSLTPAFKAKYAFSSLGCPKNLVDSERMLGLLAQDGYVLVPDAADADIVIVNTCGFIQAAREESLSVIREMLDLKKGGKVKGVIVAGCLAERQREQLLHEVPGIDHLVGVFGREEITRVADRIMGGLAEQRSVFRPAPIRALPDTARLRITPRHFAYLKISEGCDRLCTFCAIPAMRGKHATKPIEQVLDEARELAADGARELNIVAQDTTYYGLDLYGRVRLAELLRALDAIEGIDWLRVLYAYPQFFTDELIETLASCAKVLPYLDLPLQHINDTMLRRMNRKHSRRETERLIGRLRDAIPGLALRTTFIVGFPGETADQFEELLEFVRTARFERLGVFEYSWEPDTPAARLPGQVAAEVKAERRDRMMAAQQAIAFAWNRARVGETLDVLIDAPAAEVAEGVWMGRTFADAPEVDATVFVQGDDLAAGDLTAVQIVAAEGYDLIGQPVEDRAGPPGRARWSTGRNRNR